MEQLSCWKLFQLSLGLKVIACLQFGPWKFRKLQFSPFFHLQPAAVGRPRPPPACRAAHASHRSFSTALWLRAGPLPPAPRAQRPARGRHLAAAVEGPLQHLGLPSCVRLSSPGDLATHSTRPLARSLPQTRRTPPPPRVNSDELTPAVDPPLRSSSALADHSISYASSYRSSPAPSSRPTPTGTTPPP